MAKLFGQPKQCWWTKLWLSQIMETLNRIGFLSANNQQWIIWNCRGLVLAGTRMTTLEWVHPSCWWLPATPPSRPTPDLSPAWQIWVTMFLLRFQLQLLPDLCFMYVIYLKCTKWQFIISLSTVKDIITSKMKRKCSHMWKWSILCPLNPSFLHVSTGRDRPQHRNDRSAKSFGYFSSRLSCKETGLFRQ